MNYKQFFLAALYTSLIYSVPSFANFNSIDYSEFPVTDNKILRLITDTYRDNPERLEDFITLNNGVVLDEKTGLQWMQCSLGQAWNKNECLGEPTILTWENAVKNSHANHWAEYSDWRLPTMRELETLVICTEGLKGKNECNGSESYPKIAESVFPNTGGTIKYKYYWTSTPSRFEGSSYLVDFNDGETNEAVNQLNKFSVRLVR